MPQKEGKRERESETGREEKKRKEKRKSKRPMDISAQSSGLKIHRENKIR